MPLLVSPGQLMEHSPSIEIELQPKGSGNEFRTQGLPGEVARRDVISRTGGPFGVFCDLLEVSHGTLGTTAEGELATLMVFRFRFIPKDKGRRIRKAEVQIELFPPGRADSNFKLHGIAPEELRSLNPTVDHEEILTGGNMSLGASGAHGIEAGGEIKREKTVSRDLSTATRISGEMRKATGKTSGPWTCALWSLLENGKRESGVPDALRVALLLERPTDERFKAEVLIDVKTDLIGGIRNWGRKVPLDDPLLFDPVSNGDSSGKGVVRRIGVQNLGLVNLYARCGARMEDSYWTFDPNYDSEERVDTTEETSDLNGRHRVAVENMGSLPLGLVVALGLPPFLVVLFKLLLG